MDQSEHPASPAFKLTTVDKLRLLLDITKRISRSLDLEEVLNLVMDTLGSLLPYDAAGIYLIDSSPEDKSPYIFKSRVIRGYQISFDLIEPRLKMGEGFLGTVEIMDWSFADGLAAAQIRRGLRRRGTSIGEHDLLIAGQAINRGWAVVSGNLREFLRVDTLDVFDWTAT